MSTFAITAKALTAIDVDDINMLIRFEISENNLIEFKKEPPGGRWNADQKLNDEGRDGIIKEVIAFANSFGGTLFIGIDETADHPKRASGLTPVPKAADLADRIERCFRDCIDPQLIYPEIVPLITNAATGDGVLLVRVRPSPLAPHWNRPKGKCYRRMGADSMEIGMLDIQSLTLERAKTADQINALFVERHHAAVTYLASTRGSWTRNVIGWHEGLDFPAAFSLRCTAVPTMPLRIDGPISTRPDLKLGTTPVFVKSATGPKRQLSWYGTFSPNSYLPALREWRFSTTAGSPTATHLQLVTASGLIESRYVECSQANQDNLRAPVVMQLDFLFTMIFSMLYQIETFKKRTGYDGLAYELEVEVLTEGLVQIRYLHGFEQPGSLKFDGKHTLFPRYLIQSAHTFSKLAEFIQHDVYNAMGRQIGGHGIVQLDLDETAMLAYT